MHLSVREFVTRSLTAPGVFICATKPDPWLPNLEALSDVLVRSVGDREILAAARVANGEL